MLIITYHHYIPQVGPSWTELIKNFIVKKVVLIKDSK